MTTLPENARTVRDEDAFDVDAVAAWLAENAGIAGVPEVRQFSGGASNLTYLLRYPDRDLVLRRPPAGAKPSSGHDMAREYRIQSMLAPVYPYVPTMVGLCTDHSVLGSDFYVMDRVPGTILRTNPPTQLDLSEADTRTLCLRIVDLLVELHGIDPESAGLSGLGRGSGYVARQVAGWTSRYAKARTDNVPDFARVTEWLAARQPQDVAQTVIHGDFRLDNIVLDENDPLKPLAVLDWELATIGDPLMDLGSSLAYWVQADDDDMLLLTKRQPSDLPGMLTRQEIVEYYSERTGLPVDGWGFYEVFGLFRLAVIAQQIYYRYHHGHTTNPAFKDFWIVVGYLESRCSALIDRYEKESR
ncbi:MAG: phosphotransferase family protein [Rhodococcus sp. (in: high G+C Gram-positive bacteria)]|uniref:Aminoglycoside phosphotransferase (APT) family kinase protein n=1 Tax=Rhodococcus rhodochrous J45 TaxID=935266 RepID=A0A562ESM1_RHORH|nr:phosphotransferase family protein [Rhodococcus rhodochrous]MCR8693242.1 phosphotransferase family protein [Rhodococcus pyridinivorans]MXQ78479.1 phosphotransferase [Rhodococcus rhodochrous]TWH24768.1 aminoglycoside phosphotransferase (APT) family kinase protein [Rhodococcus rhodochrous J45]